MSHDQHQGAVAPSPLVQHADPRVGEIDTALRSVESVIQAIAPGLTLFRDPNRAAQQNMQQLSEQDGQVLAGTIIHPIAGMGWYKVQLGNQHGFVPCCAVSSVGAAPLGAREVGAFAPNSQVLVYKPRGHKFGYIVGVIPPLVRDGRIVNPDWVVQGGQSGYKREALHKQVFKSMYKKGGVQDFSGQRPMDSTSLERGIISATGIALTIDDFLAQLRVNEMCGLFLSYFDSYTRLAGMQMDIESLVHHVQARDDEGEARLFIGYATYPWEALGLYAPGQKFTETNGDVEVQYTEPVAKEDLPKGERDLQPIYRYQEYAGYLGQGHLRMVCKPAKDDGKRRFSEQEPDEGLFCESIALDGTYSVRSAKSVYIGKRVLIVVPKEIKYCEDKQGDYAEKNNYKFSGKFGGGPEHKMIDIKVTGQHKHIRRVAGIMDFIAHTANWKSLHPFHYHQGDYKTWQEPQASKVFKGVMENLDFGVLASQPYMRDPTPKRLKIDHRYNQVEYFERESYLYMLDDGGVVLADGYGSSIVMTAGVMRIESPGDVQLCPGRHLLGMAGQVILRAKGSLDLSSSDKDVRIKAERNMQLLAGNAGQGGMLLETKSKSRTQMYEERIGERVRANGIVIKATGGFAGVYGKEIYLRTGGGKNPDGDILIDASQGKKDVIIKTNRFNLFSQKEVNFFYGPVGESSTVDKVYHFGRKNMIADVKLLLGGKLISYTGGGGKGGVIIDGGCYGVKSFATAGVMADKKGFFLGKVPDGFGGIIQSATQAAAQAADQLKQMGEKLHEAKVVQRYYQDMQPGDDKVISNMEFSYRDEPGNIQYKTQTLKWAESRWQMFVRMGIGTGGTTWTEKPVQYQGQELYPWPGREKWKEDSSVFLRFQNHSMFDPGEMRDKNRPGPYEDAQLGDMDATTMEQGYKIIMG